VCKRATLSLIVIDKGDRQQLAEDSVSKLRKGHERGLSHSSKGFSKSPDTLHPFDHPLRLLHTMTDTTKQVDQSWQPPTPTSTQIAFHSPNLPVDHLVLLPPPLVPTHNSQNRRRSTSDQDQVNRFYPSQLLPPLELPSQSSSTSHVQAQMRHCSPPTMSWEEEYTKPPRRSAAIAAARNIPRNPSPLELDSDDGSFSPPPLVVPSSAANSAGAASKRKVSHSLIERRRREKINDCLATLKETVPNLKEEGEKKIAKAKERGRKRGRGDDAGERGGLHKLEILQVRRRRFARFCQ